MARDRMSYEQSDAENPRLSPAVRVFFSLVALIVLGGSLLLIFPSLIVPHWAWPLAPFNARFLGAIYLSEFFAAAILAAVNRWSPGRLALPSAFVFTLVISIVSLFSIDKFSPGRLATYTWFVLYLGSVVIIGYFVWHYRNLAPANLVPMPGALRMYLMVATTILGLYGIAMILMPGISTAFWPWAIDDFHARLYSGFFLTGAVGGLILLRGASPLEIRTLGLAQVAVGIGAILGLVIVDAGVHRVDWSTLGTWVWIAGFGIMLIAGVGMVWQSFRRSTVMEGGRLAPEPDQQAVSG